MTLSTQYLITPGSGIDSLKRVHVDVPDPGYRQVLVRIRATSLNHRDLLIARGSYPTCNGKDVVPLSDGAGEVIAVGPDVSRFKAGDRVSGIFMQRWLGGEMHESYAASALGATEMGVLSEYRLFDEDGLVHVPESLTFADAATLPCAAVTAWNALFGSMPLLPGQTVLIMGTGGVSIFALQFAVAAGANVIITSSSDKKLNQSQALGAQELINYSRHADWEREVIRVTGGVGVDRVIETGGTGTLQKSLASTRCGGSVHLIGVLTTGHIDPMPLLTRRITIRGFQVGSREMFESMNAAIEVNKITPVIDRSFAFTEASEAFHYLESAKHFGKVVIEFP